MAQEKQQTRNVGHFTNGCAKEALQGLSGRPLVGCDLVGSPAHLV